MKIFKKSIISILFALCVILFVQNISWADWVGTGGDFERNTYSSYNWNNRPYNNGRLYVTANIFIKNAQDFNNRKFGQTYPKLDINVRSTLLTTW